MTERELATLKIARNWLPHNSTRQTGLSLIDDMIAMAEREHAAATVSEGEEQGFGVIAEGTHP